MTYEPPVYAPPSYDQAQPHPGKEGRELGKVALGLAIAAVVIFTLATFGFNFAAFGERLGSSFYQIVTLVIRFVDVTLSLAALVLGIVAIRRQRHQVVPAIAVGIAATSLFSALRYGLNFVTSALT